MMQGYITGDLGKTTQRSAFVDNRRNDDMGHKADCITTETPALDFAAPFAHRTGQFLLRHPLGDIFWRVKNRKMSSQHLGGGVTLDALGACIPAGNSAFGVEHEYRVVSYAFHQ